MNCEICIVKCKTKKEKSLCVEYYEELKRKRLTVGTMT